MEEFMIIYYNPSYYNNEDTYFMYIENGGMYLNGIEETKKVLIAPREEVTKDNVDNFAESRGFEKAVMYNSTEIVWYNDFKNDQDKQQQLLKRMKDAKKYIINVMRYKQTKDPYMGTIYSILTYFTRNEDEEE